jgi:hypothetical protein
MAYESAPNEEAASTERLTRLIASFGSGVFSISTGLTLALRMCRERS